MTIIQNCRCCGDEIFIRDYTSYAVCDRCIGKQRVMVYYSKEEKEEEKKEEETGRKPTGLAEGVVAMVNVHIPDGKMYVMKKKPKPLRLGEGPLMPAEHEDGNSPKKKKKKKTVRKGKKKGESK